MYLLVVSVIGAFLGALLGFATRTQSGLAFAVEICSGIFGAASVAWVVAPLGRGPGLNVPEVIGALVGAVFFLKLLKSVFPIRKRKPK